MKRLISISLVTIAVCFQVMAQLPPVFPTERDKFPKVLEDYLRSTHMENAMKAADDFSAAVKSAAITDGMLQQMAATANVMSQRQMTPNPYFTAFVNAAVGFGKNKVSAEQFANWSKVAQELAVNQRKGDNKDYQKFMEFSVAFANKGAMYATSTKMWISDSKNYTLVYEGGKALLRFPSNMNLYGYTTSDTLVVKETRGDFSPAENKWMGRFGRLDWTRNKLPASSVYALVKSDYNITYDNFQFSIDTVEFYYKDFFATPLYGRYTNKFVADGDSTSSYPRFDSRGDAITLKDVVPHCSFTGNFDL